MYMRKICKHMYTCTCTNTHIYTRMNTYTYTYHTQHPARGTVATLRSIILSHTLLNCMITLLLRTKTLVGDNLTAVELTGGVQARVDAEGHIHLLHSALINGAVCFQLFDLLVDGGRAGDDSHARATGACMYACVCMNECAYA